MDLYSAILFQRRLEKIDFSHDTKKNVSLTVNLFMLKAAFKSFPMTPRSGLNKSVMAEVFAITRVNGSS